MTIEPFRIKVVEPIRMTTARSARAPSKPRATTSSRCRPTAILIDLLTDSGTGAMSAEQWAAMMRGDESYAGSASCGRFEAAVQDIFGFEHVIPTHQGRAAERILSATLVRAGRRRAQQHPLRHDPRQHRGHRRAGARPALRRGRTTSPRGTRSRATSTSRPSSACSRTSAGQVPFVMITVTNNAGGGQPVVDGEPRARRRELCRAHGVPLLPRRLPLRRERLLHQAARGTATPTTPLIDIAREMFALADGCTMSAKKDGMANIGGFLCTNDDAAGPPGARAADPHRGLPDLRRPGRPRPRGDRRRPLRGARRGLPALPRTPRPATWASTSPTAGVPIVQPPGGHAIYIDAAGVPAAHPAAEYPGQALAIALYRAGRHPRGRDRLGDVRHDTTPRPARRRQPRTSSCAWPSRAGSTPRATSTTWSRSALEVAARKETIARRPHRGAARGAAALHRRVRAALASRGVASS